MQAVWFEKAEAGKGQIMEILEEIRRKILYRGVIYSDRHFSKLFKTKSPQ